MNRSWLVSVMVLCGCASAPVPPPGLRSMRVGQAPIIDGRDADDAWRGAKLFTTTARRVMPPLGASVEVSIRSVHTDSHVYFLVSWRDGTRDDASHKPWTWSAARSAYEEGPEREDMLAIAFELSGPFDEDMLSGAEGAWDVWQWKASRTDPQGFAMDRTHRTSRAKPEGKARAHAARQGGDVWIARPEDAGETVEKKQPAPAAKAGDRVPQYLPGVPSGSAADVAAKGGWNDGTWTVEFARKLDTGHPDDTVFDVSRRLKMALSVHDRTGDMDKATGAIELSFTR